MYAAFHFDFLLWNFEPTCFVMEVLNLDMELLLIELERCGIYRKRSGKSVLVAYSFLVDFLAFWAVSAENSNYSF